MTITKEEELTMTKPETMIDDLADLDRPYSGPPSPGDPTKPTYRVAITTCVVHALITVHADSQEEADRIALERYREDSKKHRLRSSSTLGLPEPWGEWEDVFVEPEIFAPKWAYDGNTLRGRQED